MLSRRSPSLPRRKTVERQSGELRTWQAAYFESLSMTLGSRGLIYTRYRTTWFCNTIRNSVTCWQILRRPLVVLLLTRMLLESKCFPDPMGNTAILSGGNETSPTLVCIAVSAFYIAPISYVALKNHNTHTVG